MPDLKMLSLADGQLQARPDIDLTFDGAGKITGGPLLAVAEEAASQDVIRGLLTLTGTNPSAPSFGTIISTLANSRATANISGTLSEEIQAVLGYLANVSADFDPTEQVVQIVNLKVQQNIQTLQVALTVQTGAGAEATVTVSP
jgi:hypothetical protein